MVVPEIHVATAEAFAESAAAEIAREICVSVARRSSCRLALAGGGTPLPVYRALALIDNVPWSNVEIFWGDERAVPPEHEASNYAAARAALIDLLPTPPRAVHRIRGELSPAEAARDYVETLGAESLDVVLLGMGGDGHTASLFPGTEDESGARVIATVSPNPPPQRISLSEATINEGRSVYLLVAGAGKANRIADVRQQITRGEPILPVARVQPISGMLFWLLDQGAAAQLATCGGQ